jgi:hypothetical protein
MDQAAKATAKKRMDAVEGGSMMLAEARGGLGCLKTYFRQAIVPPGRGAIKNTETDGFA